MTPTPASDTPETDEPETTILIVEDEDDIRYLIKLMLESAGYQTCSVSSGAEALALIAERHVDLILLDILMPGMDGYQVARQIQSNPATSDIPIIMVSVLTEVGEQVLGLNLGADDYICKPIEPSLLLARINARLRRAEHHTEPERIAIGRFAIDRSERAVYVGTQHVDVTDAEFDLLWLLASHAGKVLTREEISRSVRGLEYNGVDRSIDMRISRLRKLLGDDSANPELIKSVRNKGYLFSRLNWGK